MTDKIEISRAAEQRMGRLVDRYREGLQREAAWAAVEDGRLVVTAADVLAADAICRNLKIHQAGAPDDED